MSNFKEFVGNIETSSDKALPTTQTTLPAIESALTLSIVKALSSLALPSDKKQEFSESVSRIMRDEAFVSELSKQIGVPSKCETEDNFVENSSRALRKMLYARFGIKE